MTTSLENRPRILFLDHVGELGGAELCLVDMVRHMKDRSKVVLMSDGPLREVLESMGADVSVLSLAKNVSGVRRASGILRSILAVPHVLLLARKISRIAKEYDLVWANSQKSFVVGCFAASLAGRPLVWHLHDILTADHFSYSNRRIAITLANRYASRVVTVSKAGMQSFIDSKGRPELSCVVYDGIDERGFVPVTASTGSSISIRKEFGIADAPLVGDFGRLTPWKGQDVLIRALPFLKGVHAVFVGDALFSEMEHKESLRSLAEELGVADRTHFAGFRENIADIMSEMDVVAHTSTSPEPFGRVLVEAMLVRRPLIASDAGGPVEIVENGKDGVLVPPGNPTLLAAAIRDVLENKASSQIRVDHAYDTAISRFSLEKFLAGVDAVAAAVAPPSNTALVSDRRTTVWQYHS